MCSAGTQPVGHVHPLAIAVMSEIGLDIRGHTSKHVATLADRPCDLVVTVCDSARETYPVWPAAQCTAHWTLDDLARARGSDADRLPVFRRVRA